MSPGAGEIRPDDSASGVAANQSRYRPQVESYDRRRPPDRDPRAFPNMMPSPPGEAAPSRGRPRGRSRSQLGRGGMNVADGPGLEGRIEQSNPPTRFPQEPPNYHEEPFDS
jgi:hypothetical protein